MRGNGRFLVVALVFALGAAGCGSLPQSDIDLAKASLDKAAAAGADKYASGSMKAAQQAQAALDAEVTAQEGKWFKSYGKSQDLAIAVQAAADKAAADAAASRKKVIDTATKGDAPSGPNLFRNGDFSEGLVGWARVPSPGVDVRVEPLDKTHGELRVHVADATSHVVVLQGIPMKPDTPYVYEMDVKSTGRIAALYWSSDVARFETEKSFPEWTKLRSVFITPRWDGKPRSGDFHPVLTEGAGDILVRNVRLAELKID